MTTKKQTKPTQWAYTDRTQGKIVSVNPPVNGKGKIVRRSKTKTGGLLGGIGFGGVIGKSI
jgi:hypothetical protein